MIVYGAIYIKRFSCLFMIFRNLFVLAILNHDSNRLSNKGKN
jgi:hypothetical protein